MDHGKSSRHMYHLVGLINESKDSSARGLESDEDLANVKYCYPTITKWLLHTDPVSPQLFHKD